MPRRAAILVLIALALGAITTFVSCWGIAWWSSIHPRPSRAATAFTIIGSGTVIYGIDVAHVGHHRLVLDITNDHSTIASVTSASPTAALPAKAIGELPKWAAIPPISGSTVQARQFTTDAYGVPCRAMRGMIVEALPRDPKSRGRSVVRLQAYWRPGGNPYATSPAFTLGIIWPGFIINTLTYTLVWFVLLFAARRATRALITRRRLRRGVCPMCSYDLRGDHASGCPECGWNRGSSV